MSVAESTTQPAAPAPPVHTRAVIIGTGFSGLGMAIALQKQGVDFVILEKADDIGGTWRDNTYPGCACDVPSHLYSFSFEPKADWSKLFSPQPEILEYLKGVTEKYGLRRYIRFGSLSARATWDDSEYRWHVFTESGQEYVTQFVISGIGALHIPRLPDIEGIDEFRGAAFHSAQWDHTVDLAGKRVAVIGTGASAIQIVPELVRRDAGVAEVQLYQRTPPWVMPRADGPIPDGVRRAFANVPGLRLAVRSGIYWGLESLGYAMTQRPGLLRAVQLVGKWNIRRNVPDKDLRRKLTPRYRTGCKRMLYSPNYYQAVANPKTTLITDRITRISPHGIVTEDGVEHPVDVIVYATGFHVADSFTYLDIKGPRGEDLVDRWKREGLVAHRGVAVADIPNMFFLLGPNTGLGHTSVVFMIESQIHYVTKAIAAVDKAGAQALAPSRSAQDRFNTELQDELAGSVWNTGGCSSWYFDDHGVNRTQWSGMTWQYWRSIRSLKLAEYRFFGVGTGAAAERPAVAVSR